MTITTDTIKELSKNLNEPRWLTDRRLAIFDQIKDMSDDYQQYGQGIGADYEALNFLDRDFSVPATSVIADGAQVMHFDEALRHKQLSAKIKENLFLREDALTSNIFFGYNASLFTDGYVIRLKKNLKVPLIELFVSQNQPNSLTYIMIICEEGSAARFLESIDVHEYHGLIIDVVVEKGARCDYDIVQNLSPEANLFISRNSRLAQDASIEWVELNLGGGRVKSSVVNELTASGADAVTSGVFMGSGDQLFDLYTATDHKAGHTTSDMLVKGALDDSAKAIYRGLIKIRKGSDNCRGYQKEETLLLSSKAEIDAVPDLEIENNEVKCSHGITTSKIDPEKLFYLTSRGYTHEEALRAFLDGHFSAVLDKLDNDGLKADVLAIINEKINSKKK